MKNGKATVEKLTLSGGLECQVFPLDAGSFPGQGRPWSGLTCSFCGFDMDISIVLAYGISQLILQKLETSSCPRHLFFHFFPYSSSPHPFTSLFPLARKMKTMQR